MRGRIRGFLLRSGFVVSSIAVIALMLFLMDSVTTPAFGANKILPDEYVSTYGRNGILFYSPCRKVKRSKGGSSGDGSNNDGSSSGGSSGSSGSGSSGNFTANCHVDELTWNDLNGLGGNEALRLVVEHYGEFAMLLQKYYGIPWEMPFAIMVYESQVGTDLNSVSGRVKQDGYFNMMGLDHGACGTIDHYRVQDYTYDSNGHPWSGYSTISSMLLGYAVFHVKNNNCRGADNSSLSTYDTGLNMLSPDNYRLREGVASLMATYCSTAEGSCYGADLIMNIINGTNTTWTAVAEVRKEKGWKSAAELAKEWNIQPGGIAVQKWGWGDIREKAWQEWGESGVPCSDGATDEAKDGNTTGKEGEDADKGSSGETGDGTTVTSVSEAKLHKPTHKWLDNAGLDGFKILKALNSQLGGNQHIDSSAMKLGTDTYESFASDAGAGVGLPGFIVLHWTAVNGYSGAGSGGDYSWQAFGDGTAVYPPHFTIDVVNKRIWQYFPLSSPSAAVAVGDGVSWDKYGIQIEVVGSGEDANGGLTDSRFNIYKFTDDQYEYLAKLLIAISNETGIPLTSDLEWDENAPDLSTAELKKYIGVLGHEHIIASGKIDPGKMWKYVVPALERLGYKYVPKSGGSTSGGSGSTDGGSNSGGSYEGSDSGDDEEEEVIICNGEDEDESSDRDKNDSKKASTGGEAIAATAKALAWPDENHHGEIKPEYAQAANEVGLSSFGVNLSEAQDCGHFVSVAVRKSGVDTEFPGGGTPNMEAHMHGSSLWEEITNTGSESNLKPGDVFVANSGSGGFGSSVYPSAGFGAGGHIFIYLGGAEKTASASLYTRTGNLGRGVTFSTSYSSYRIFRSTVNVEGASSTGSFDEDLKVIEKSGVKVGAAVTAPGNKDVSEVKTGGSWDGGRAWSTIKVPLAIAAIQENASTGGVTDVYGGSCNPGLSSAVADAIKASDNCSAWWLWQALGGDNSQAASKVTAVIKAGGDTSTTVNSVGNGRSLTSGMTDWSLVGQAIFAANMASINGSSSVMAAMKNHGASDGNSGLNTFTAMTKGGWGDDGGTSATRQFGIVKLKNGKCSAVAIWTSSGSSFSVLNKIAQVLLNHEDDLPSGTCPGGL